MSKEKKLWEELKNRGNKEVFYNGYKVEPIVFQLGKVRIYYLEYNKPEEWVDIECLKCQFRKELD